MRTAKPAGAPVDRPQRAKRREEILFEIWLQPVRKLDEQQQIFFISSNTELKKRLEHFRFNKCSADSAIA